MSEKWNTLSTALRKNERFFKRRGESVGGVGFRPVELMNPKGTQSKRRGTQSF